MAREEEAVYHARASGSLINLRHKPRLIDLFCGAGGMTLGFTKLCGHCFMPVWANDNNSDAVRTYNMNFGEHCIEGDINDILANGTIRIPEADVVIGGPPCQGFSLLNKRRDGDPRKQLWRPFMEVVKRSGASIFVMENVPQLLDTFEHGEIKETARQLGFMTIESVLCAADYGVPQTRKRAFIVGCNFKDPCMFFPPKKTNYNPKSMNATGLSEELDDYIVDPLPWRTVRDAIADLKKPEGTEIRKLPPPYDLHFGRTPTELSKRRYRAIPKEGMNRFDLQRLAPDLTPACWIRKTEGGTDLFGRLWWDRPAFTIRTEFFKPEKGRYLHPVQNRPITHREAARFQSFPDTFKFFGKKIDIARQIGNAVPPLMAARVADTVFSLWLSRPN
ncbi:MAG TPA: DNA cytosine methyltransferase [Candidatus Hydrogenedentes bacterium]|nr:DNA cytosine methyltransferase [Candidatus Hydrogenedentota bacterium]